jgi:formate dehydrogenase
MLIAAHVVGCEAIYIYLRDEYHDCRALLTRELAAIQADPPCPLPRIELRRGAGAYICGEESAMIESIEGKRGEPRLRPPYIAQTGLFGRPTLEHNFETLYWVRDILTGGPDWFAEHGRHGRKGFRSFSVSGRVKSPGVKLAPAGISLRELIDEHCGGMADGHTLYAYLPGGASGGIFPASLADVPLDFDTLQPYGGFIGSAAVVVLSQHDKARDAAFNAMQFFANESCGQCTPCRAGTAKAAELMKAPVWDANTLEDLNQVMADASICGLGQAAPNPVRCVLKYFAHEVGP